MITIRAAAGLGSSNRLVVTSCSRNMVSVAGDPGISSGEGADEGPGFFTVTPGGMSRDKWAGVAAASRESSITIST
jgi:hypothetical protein